MTDLSRDFGQLEGRFKAMEDRLNRIESKIDSIVSEVSDMRSFQDRQRGAVTFLMALSSAITAAVVYGVNWLLHR